MKKNLILKKGLLVGAILIIALISVFVISPSARSPEFHEKTIQTLDEKKITVLELTAATAIGSTALAAIPGDATTPIANQIAKLSSYLLIVMGAIFLEKILLTITGYLSFTFLIPISCLLYGIYLFAKNEVLKHLAIKLSIFGIAIFMIVPISVKVSNLIENTYQTSINQTIEEAKNSEIVVEESTQEDSEESGILDELGSKIKDSISNIGESVSNMVEKGKKTLSNLIDAIAVLLITSCVIPIIVLLFFVWIVKIIFGITIPVYKIKKQDKTEE